MYARAAPLRLAIESTWLLLTFHHLAFDGWSFEVFMGRLKAALYRSGRDHGAVACPPSVLPIQVHYADYAERRRWMDVASLPSQLSYWKRQLAGPLPVLRLPTDRPGRR